MTEKWALILGASSGFGAACSRALARAGFNIVGVHLDRKAAMPRVQQVIDDIKGAGVEALFFNKNIADDDNRAEIVNQVEPMLRERGAFFNAMLHSVAFGSLLPYIADDPKKALSRSQLEMTLDVMGNSLVYWVQELVRCNLLQRGSKVFSMTSAGSHRVIAGYGPVSAAKAVLESHTRQLALELGPRGICVNCFQAGVTDTPALRMIPNSDKIMEEAIRRNPGARLTTPEDIANTFVALMAEQVAWINGTVIRVDGGEDNI